MFCNSGFNIPWEIPSGLPGPIFLKLVQWSLLHSKKKENPGVATGPEALH
jgi:hypothetical protein